MAIATWCWRAAATPRCKRCCSHRSGGWGSWPAVSTTRSPPAARLIVGATDFWSGKERPWWSWSALRMPAPEPDDECDLDYTPLVCRAKKIETALKLSLGFGGHLVAAVIRAVDRGADKAAQ